MNYCDFKKQTKNINQKTKDTKTIIHIDFNQNPAEDYFFTRKYRLTKNSLYYYKDGNFQEMERSKYLFSKDLIDSLPIEITDKKYIGYTTVEIDIPDWTIEIYYEDKKTIYLASGGLPDNMKNYNDIAWRIITKLDSEK